MDPLSLLLTIWLVCLGLVIGSFLNVVIARVPHGQSIVRPRSRCPRCGHTLSWYENIPVLSWVGLRGRCRSCKLGISPRYPLVELLTALLFLACLRRFGWTPELALALMMVTLLVPLTFIDLEHYLLPFSLTLPGIAAGVVLSIPVGWDRLRDAVIGAAVGFLAFWAMEWIGEKIFKKEALGGGDKYLLALIGAFLTFRPLLGVIFLASLQGSLIGVALLLTRGRAGPELPPDEVEESEETEEPSIPPVLGAASSAPADVKPPLAPHGNTPGSEGGGSQTASGASAMPADERAQSDEEEDWVPGPTNMPFGPYLALAALELLFFSSWIDDLIPHGVGRFLTGGL